MRSRSTALALFGFACLVVVANVVMNVPQGEWFPASVIGLWLLCVAGVGTAIASNRSDNPIGWIMLLVAVFVGGGLFVEAYASYSLELGRADLPFATVAAWFSLWLTIPGFAALIFVLLLFPNGEPQSPRWRFVGWLTVASTLGQAVLLAFRRGPVPNVKTVENPVGLWAFNDLDLIKNITEWGLGLSAIAALIALAVRFRRSKGIERQQMKWFATGAATFPLCFGLVMILDAVLELPEPDYVGFLINMAGLLAIPLSMGVAILRYRLYDIDVILNRTVVYALLTAVLLTCYLALVVALSRLFEPVTPDSDLAVAASTLAVAALFRPVRTRIQRFIDRRFYRSKYDGARAIADFSARLRDEIDVETVREDVVGVVGMTVQPAHVSVWIRSEATG